MFASLTPGQARILSAARVLVKRRGYARVSLRGIATASRYSPAGLYAHFKGRDAILETLADLIRDELVATLERAAAAEKNPRSSLVAIGLSYVGYALDRPAEFDLLFRHTRSRKRNRRDRSFSAFDLLRRIASQAAPDAIPNRVDLVCLGFWACAHGLASLRATHFAELPGDWDAWTQDLLRLQVEKVVCGAL